MGSGYALIITVASCHKKMKRILRVAALFGEGLKLYVMVGLFSSRMFAGLFSNQNEQRALVSHVSD